MILKYKCWPISSHSILNSRSISYDKLTILHLKYLKRIASSTSAVLQKQLIRAMFL